MKEINDRKYELRFYKLNSLYMLYRCTLSNEQGCLYKKEYLLSVMSYEGDLSHLEIERLARIHQRQSIVIMDL